MAIYICEGQNVSEVSSYYIVVYVVNDTSTECSI